jgi:flagellar hook-basal body protein
MIRGLYTAASGMLTAMRRMELVTNNLANAQTVEFKQDRTATSTFAEVLILQDGTPAPLTPDAPLVMLGMATASEEPLLDFTQGSLQETGRSLDLALEGPGFFSIQTADGIRYTRDGGFTRDALGRMTTGEGDLVLGVDGNPIEIPGGGSRSKTRTSASLPSSSSTSISRSDGSATTSSPPATRAMSPTRPRRRPCARASWRRLTSTWPALRRLCSSFSGPTRPARK